MNLTQHVPNSPTLEPRHTFLLPREVFSRYRWGRTKGYEMLKSAGFPADIAGAYRLDLLIAWEERHLAAAASAAADGAPEPTEGSTAGVAVVPAADERRAGDDLDEHGLPMRKVSRRNKNAVR